MLALGLGFVLNQDLPVPPSMARRAIAPEQPGPVGSSTILEDGPYRFTLFLPESVRRDRSVELAIHFHTAEWHVIQEHTRRGLGTPLVVFNNGQGSSAYAKPFNDVSRFPRLCQSVLRHLRERGWPADSHVSAVDVSSFSAGYGAVRELVRQPYAFGLMRRVILGDSLYGSLDATQPIRKPLHEHVAVWEPLARAAMRGAKTFLITVSEVPTETYASSSEVAGALAELVGVPIRPGGGVAPDPEFSLDRRADKGRFHVWFYRGNDAPAHMTHARHLADVWLALDRAGAP